jgi:hypothetical protein
MMYIPLSQGKVAVVDEADHPRFSEFRWCFRADRDKSTGCAVRHVNRDGKDRLSYQHREVMDAPAGKNVIFINHDKLDCRRTNLKIVSKQEACWHHRVRRDSKTGIKGVKFNRAWGTWSARICRKGVYHHLGSFPTKEAACEAYRQAETRLAQSPVGPGASAIPPGQATSFIQ